MTECFSCHDDEERERGLRSAVVAVRRGALVVFPTDTVYGVGSDTFDPRAVRRLLRAKRRGRDMPPPVLVSAVTTLDALATDVTEPTRMLVEAFWPGPLTVVCRQQASLMWDLGDNRGTVALRMPDNEIALALLARTGPMAVSSANLNGHAAATTADDAQEMLADSVDVYLDGGPTAGALPSTIVDTTGEFPAILRVGAVSVDQLREVAPDIVDVG